MPAIVASSDSGFGGGILIDLYDHRLPTEPYDAKYEVILTATSKKEQNYSLSLDKPSLSGSDYRLKAEVLYERTPQSQFFGVGAQSQREPALEELGFYQHERRDLSAKASLQKKLLPCWSIVGQVVGKRLVLSAESQSLFAKEPPIGAEGGLFTEWGIGLLRDSRDREVWPTSGGFDELSVRTSTAPFNQAPYIGANVTLRRYVSLSPWTTLGLRAAADVLSEGAPFFAQERFGLEGYPSVGGSGSLRGFPRARFIGAQKLLASAELRALPWSAKPFGFSLDLGFAAFLDAGEILEQAPDALRVAEGVGFRLVYEKDFVVRIDAAHSSEDAVRLYLDVGHPF